MTRYAILEVYGPQDPEFAVNKIEAESGVDALAVYSMAAGFADPRQFIGTDEDFFCKTSEGLDAMVFGNTELKAVPVSA